MLKLNQGQSSDHQHKSARPAPRKSDTPSGDSALRTNLVLGGITPARKPHPQIAIAHNLSKPAGGGPHNLNHDIGKWCTDLTSLMENSKRDVVGRSREIDRLIRVMNRHSKGNAILVGEPGVGKTAIVEALAKRIAREEVPANLFGRKIWSLDVSSIMSGAKHRGESEDRIKQVVSAIINSPGDILFIDEIHTIINASDVRGGVGFSDILKPELTKGKLRIIGATTFNEYKTYFERDAALSRRFVKINISSLEFQDIVKIIDGYLPILGKHHKISFLPDMSKLISEYALRHLPRRQLPDKAIDLLEDAAALAASRGHREVGLRHIEYSIMEMTGSPYNKIRQRDADIGNLPDFLNSCVFGQEAAIDAISRAVWVSHADLRDEHKPRCNLLLAGPTGVGKTEVCKKLSDFLNLDLIRFDMSEYQESHSVARLIGAPPGYVGYEKGGLLTDSVDMKPHALVILDEIEKAHRDIFNLLLQVMDYGTLTDGNGRPTDFRNISLVMTSNIGADIPHNNDDDFEKRLLMHFPPEFRERLDAVVRFNHISMESVKMIVLREIDSLSRKLSVKGVQLEIDNNVIHWMSELCFHQNRGARNVQRTVDRFITSVLAKEISSNRLKNGNVKFVMPDETLIGMQKNQNAPIFIKNQ